MQSDPLIGIQLGAYRVESLLGEGGMARVYKAYHERLQRVVAIKLIQPQSAANFRVRFEQEAKLIASLQHRNIVTVYDFGENESMVYLVMQFVAGGTLQDQLRSRQPLAPRRAALYALQMARALHHAHMHGIVHRDVKPLNMLIPATHPNELLLSDFGLAKLFVERTESLRQTGIMGMNDIDQTLSHVGDIIGTPRYMSPEQCLRLPIDGRTDIYSLGIVLFEMLTGQLPFQGGELTALLYQHAYIPAPSVHQINPAVPESLVEITARALQKKPELRYQSAREMARAIDSVLTPAIPLNPTSISVPVPAMVPPLPTPTSLQSATPSPLSETPLPQPAPGLLPGNTPVVPARDSRRKRRVRVINVVALSLIITLLLVQTLLHVVNWPWLRSTPSGSPIAAPCTATSSAAQVQPFVEQFRDNHRGWQQDVGQGITPTIKDNVYILSVANSNRAYFLCPDAIRVGLLPANFSLTTQIAQNQGSPDAFYGLAFRVNQTQGTDKIAGYAFVMNGHNTCALFKYDPSVPKGYTVLQSQSNVPGLLNAPDTNTLQVIVQGSHLMFKVNNQPVLINGTDQGQQGINDTSFTGGQLALLVSGPNTRFTVTYVQLTIP